MSISGNLVGSYSQLGRTFVLIDENGMELTGVVVDQETIFTAGDNDVREGKVYASDDGVSTGTKVIPTYHTNEGYRLIPAGSEFTLKWSNTDIFNYTKLQCIICPFNSSVRASVAAEKVVIEDNVYEVNSSTSIAIITKDMTNSTIDLGIVNNTSASYLIRYFTYREIE